MVYALCIAAGLLALWAIAGRVISTQIRMRRLVYEEPDLSWLGRMGEALREQLSEGLPRDTVHELGVVAILLFAAGAWHS